jgi:hypothetical protein
MRGLTFALPRPFTVHVLAVANHGTPAADSIRARASTACRSRSSAISSKVGGRRPWRTRCVHAARKATQLALFRTWPKVRIRTRYVVVRRC